MGLAIPDLIETANSDRSKLIACIRDSGETTVELLDAKGNCLGQLDKTMINRDQGTDHTIRWDGTNPKSGQKDIGEYLVCWTLSYGVDTERRVEPLCDGFHQNPDEDFQRWQGVGQQIC